ncbi:hypothetical protein GGI12_004439, partial [Dipsacomyces acuminosporus]
IVLHRFFRNHNNRRTNNRTNSRRCYLRLRSSRYYTSSINTIRSRNNTNTNTNNTIIILWLTTMTRYHLNSYLQLHPLYSINIDGFPLSSATGINILKLDDDVENSIVPVSVTNTLSDGLSVSPNGSAFVNPMYILRTRDLPDLTQGLADSTLRYMYRLLGFTNDKNWLVDQNGEGIQANEKLLKHGYKQQHHLMPSLDSLPPNLDLLDPRNAAGSCITNSFGIPDHRFGSSLAPDPLDSQTPASTPTAQPLSSSSSSITKNIPQALIDVAQRHSINENPQMLYIMLKTSFIDSETAIRATQFWTTLEAGNVSDFVVLAHLAKAAREAHLKQDIEFLDPQNPLDFVCFEAAKREWYSGKATNSTGAVLALHLLSEYGFQSGRYAIMWEFAQYGVETARKISFRGAKYPWKGTRSCECDFELDNLLMCFWLAWGRLFTAAQCLTKRMQFMDSKDLPEYPMHPCQYYANVSARRGITKPDSVEFLVGPCTAVEHSCIPAIWQCYYIVAHMHNYYIDLLEHKASAQLYFQTLGSWDEDLHDWCRTWPESWTLRMQELFESARQINDEKFNGNVPLDADFCHLSKTRNATTSEHKRKKRSVDFVGLRSPENVTTGFDFTHTSHMPSPALVDLGSLTDLKLAETSPYDKKKITLSDKEDYWLVVLYTMYEMARLRAHRIALVFLYKDQFMPLHDGDPSMHVFTAPSLPSVPEGYKYVSDDPMKDAIRYYHSRFECLDAARTLQNLFTMTDLIGFPVSRIGIWVIFSLEHLISIQCGRMASNDWDTKIDAIRRLARLLRQLLTLTKWTSSLYVFTSVVKTYVDNNNSKNIFRGGEYEAMENSKYSECSPWPQDHILSILMRLMKMDAKRFCAYTLPVVFASMCTSDASATLPPDMRMSIAALIS